MNKNDLYENFEVENHVFRSSRITIKSERLVFNHIDFNSGFLSFGQAHVDCSIGTNEHKHFEQVLIDEGVDDKKIDYKDIRGFEFIDCKFSDDTFFKKGLDALVFENCTFKKRCYINNQYENETNRIEIKSIQIKNTVFENNFKLHNTKIGYFYIVDSDFKKNADFFKSEFVSGKEGLISFNSINFDQLALFGDTVFKQLLRFKYVTFKGYSHFRQAHFDQGLDLEYANIEQEMNFFGIKGLEENISATSQETYRIIKHQLQRVGNVIDSNKYHSLELNRLRDKTEWSSSRGIVLFFHNCASKHSQSWALPVVWIVVTGFLTCLSLGLSGCPCCCQSTGHFFKYISIFQVDECLKQSPVILFFNKVILGYLYYQFLTAVRRDTRK